MFTSVFPITGTAMGTKCAQKTLKERRNERTTDERRSVSLESFFPHSALPHSLQLAYSPQGTPGTTLVGCGRGTRWQGAGEGGPAPGWQVRIQGEHFSMEKRGPSPRASCPADPALLLLLDARGPPALTRNTRQGLGQRAGGLPAPLPPAAYHSTPYPYTHPLCRQGNPGSPLPAIQSPHPRPGGIAEPCLGLHPDPDPVA